MTTLPTLTTTALVNILIGVLLLVFGRRLFWLFVSLVGFLAGFNLAPQILPGQPASIVLMVAIIVGLLGALLAILFQRLSVGIAGFLAGGYLINILLASLRIDAGAVWWITYILGGLIGFILVLALFDWALIILSSLMGASIIVQALALASNLAILAFILLLVIGIAIQAGWMRTYQPRPARRQAD